MTLHLAIGGFGFGLVVAPLATAVIDSVAEEHRGIASSLVVLMRMVGMIIGLAAITSWGMGRFNTITFGMSLQDILTSPEEMTKSVLALFNDFFRVSVAICLAAIIPSIWLGRRKK